MPRSIEGQAVRLRDSPGRLAEAALILSLLAPGSTLKAQSDERDDKRESRSELSSAITSRYPITITDAYTTSPGKLWLQSSLQYDHFTHQDELVFTPEAQYGFSPHMHVNLSVNAMAGSGSHQGSGDVSAGWAYNFLKEDKFWPSLAVSASATIPSGIESRGLDTELGLRATKTLNRGEANDSLHLNGYWIHNSGAYAGEREQRYLLALGYSRKITDRLTLATDLVREALQTARQDSNLLEIGFIHKTTDHLRLSVGIGAGLGEESPAVRGTLGVRWQF